MTTNLTSICLKTGNQEGDSCIRFFFIFLRRVEEKRRMRREQRHWVIKNTDLSAGLKVTKMK